MGLLEHKFEDNIIVEKLDKLISWSRSTSPWFFQFGTACCAIEMMAAAASRHDLMRIGIIPRSSPRQADVMIVAGTVTMKMALRVKKLYEQMADPKYVVAMGSCATSGGSTVRRMFALLRKVRPGAVGSGSEFRIPVARFWWRVRFSAGEFSLFLAGSISRASQTPGRWTAFV